MSIIDDILRALIDRNEIVLKGAITVGLADKSVKLSADIRAEIHDKTKNNKLIATMLVPMNARTEVADMVIPVRIPRQ